MSHSRTSRRAHDAALPAREPDRVAAGAQRAAQRAPQVDVLAVAVALGAARRARRRGEPDLRSSAGRAARARRARARRSASRRSRSSSLASDGHAGRRRTAPVAAAASAPAEAPHAGRAAAPRRRVRRGRRRSHRPAPRARPSRSRRPRGARPGVVGPVHARAEDGEEHAVEGADLRRVAHQHRPRRPVQARARDRAGQRQRRSPAAPSARRVTGHARLVQPAAEGRDQRREVELDGLEPHTRRLQARGADHVLVLAVLQDAARACGRSSPRRASSTPSSSSAFSQSIASAIPGGFWTSPSRILATAVTTCTASDSRRAAHAPAHDLDLAPRRRGSRSTGTGSGA